ncbi:hypothetical protein [Streptomyces sp. NPDC048106]|uniref:hypothetical protein n=1 Tax=Streptomyces sp. NPDC048106 TaxID=3155750 RepID=UPI0034568D31
MLKRTHVALTVPALLLLVGCGSSDPASPKTHATGPRNTASPATEAETIAQLHGSWGAFFSGPTVVLNFTGRQVGLRGGGVACAGSVAREDGILTIRLKCDDPHAKRTVGKIWGLTENAMTVDWTNYGADSFTRA